MKKIWLKVSVFLLLVSILPLQSCIGSFSLTNKVLSWNKQVGSKFLNELVFFAFWVLPVYEVTAVADLLVINSIEFWSGTNPMEASVKIVDTEQGKYYITQEANKVTIKTPSGLETKLEFSDDDNTWSVRTSDDELYPFMTLLDASHVKMITPSGDFREFDLSENGVMAYSELIRENSSFAL